MNRETLLKIVSAERLQILRLGLTTGLAVLILGALLWGLRGVRASHAESDVLYVDGTTGQDTGTCGTTSNPCETISYTLHTRAEGGDTIRVAEGVYTENLLVGISVTLQGGYVPSGTLWLTRTGETIIDGSGSRPVWGEWDETWVRYPTVITDSGEYKMWYVGHDQDEVGRIGYATSPDGLNWTKHAGNPVLDVGGGSAWDSESLESPFVIHEGGVYRMWYSGQGGDGNWHTGYATSTDGIHWARYNENPILSPGTADWNNRFVHSPFVLREGQYKLWAHTAGDSGPYMAYATSSDGLSWTWEGANPLFSANPSQSWEMWIWNPSVLHLGSDYQMWYSAGGIDQNHIGYATATNEVNWTKYNGGTQPVLSGTPGAWDEEGARDPFVLYAGGVYTMWYDDGAAIGVATSTNGVDWTKYDDPILSSGTDTEWSLPVVLFVPGGDGSVLDGFTVRNGYSYSGGGIYARAQVTIQNCTVMSNTAHDGGGGIAVEWGSADVTISNTQVLSNYAGSYGGGIEIDNDALATIVNSEIVSNTATEDGGGGITVHNRASGVVTDSRILSNTTRGWASAGILVSDDALAALHANEIAWNKGYGDRGPSGGIRVNANSIVTVVNNHIYANTVNDGDGGALSANGSVVKLYSNTIMGNRARNGGGLFLVDYVDATLDGNVIAENEVEGSGGGIATDDSALTITNNLIALNRGPDSDGIVVWSGDGDVANVRVINNTIISNTAEGIQASSGTLLARNNIIYGNHGGLHNYQLGATMTSDHNAFWNNGWNYSEGISVTGDIEVDPLFVDAANGDFHLQAGSPCIDAGNPTGAPALDIEGTVRDATPDIGAYEWGRHRIFLPLTARDI